MDAYAGTAAGIKMNQKAYIDFKAAQETYLKENGWHWTCRAPGGPLERIIKWSKNGVVWMYLDDAVSEQIRHDMVQFP
jgi:hypothetical protein